MIRPVYEQLSVSHPEVCICVCGYVCVSVCVCIALLVEHIAVQPMTLDLQQTL